MKKILSGLFIIALLVSVSIVSADVTNSTSTKKFKIKSDKVGKMATSTDAACVSVAVGVREDAIVKAWGEFDDAVTKSLTDRKTALMNAWAITDVKARKIALKNAWSESKSDRKEAASAYKTVKKSAWSTFKTSAKACGGSVGSEAAGESEAGEKVEI